MDRALMEIKRGEHASVHDERWPLCSRIKPRKDPAQDQHGAVGLRSRAVIRERRVVVFGSDQTQPNSRKSLLSPHLTGFFLLVLSGVFWRFHHEALDRHQPETPQQPLMEGSFPKIIALLDSKQ